MPVFGAVISQQTESCDLHGINFRQRDNAGRLKETGDFIRSVARDNSNAVLKVRVSTIER